ncbi:MAG: hypothetical protein IKG85_04660 [Clostridia bacterium]|nr:hypothetical protein [Clostridia bacterium]
MKRFSALLIAAVVLAVCMICACSGNGGETKLLTADDPEVLAKWDEHDSLDGIPRFTMTGVFDNIYFDDDRTVVSFVAVPQEAFEAYVEELRSAGFKLKENSAIWVTEGMSAVPEFTRNGQELILVWNLNGTLDISAEAAG